MKSRSTTPGSTLLALTQVSACLCLALLVTAPDAKAQYQTSTLRSPLITGAPSSPAYQPPQEGQAPPIGDGSTPYGVTPGHRGYLPELPASQVQGIPQVPAAPQDPQALHQGGAGGGGGRARAPSRRGGRRCRASATTSPTSPSRSCPRTSSSRTSLTPAPPSRASFHYLIYHDMTNKCKLSTLHSLCLCCD